MDKLFNFIPNLMLFVLCLCATTTVVYASPEFDELQESYKQKQLNLSNSVFQQPLTLSSSFDDDKATGEIYAVVNNDFVNVSSHLIKSQQWCDMLLLHVNVKGCYTNGPIEDGVIQRLDNNELRIYMGRNFYQPVEDAYVMDYRFSVPRHNHDYLKVTLAADEGPFGTSDYLLVFEAIPLADNKTYMHFKYSYSYGFMARVAVQSYLATLGRSKVGFTIDSYDENNNPIYVKGMQGIVERNSMRYFIAIRAFLDTFSQKKDDWDKRVDLWYQLALPFERQLLEVKERKYLDTKYKEFENRVSLETALANTD